VGEGALDTLNSFTGLFAPLIGGFLLAEMGMPVLFAAVSVLFIASIFPLLTIEKAHFKLRTSLHDHSKRHEVDGKTLIELLHNGFQAESVETLFTVFLFLSGFEIISVGVVGVFFGLMGALVPMFLGKMVDINHDRVLFLGTVISVASWTAIALYPHEVLLYLAAFSLGIAYEALWLTACKRACILGKRKDPCFFGPAFEMIDEMGRGMALMFMLVLLTFAGMNTLLLGVAGVGLIFALWKSKHLL
jgi:hypothetical protein